MPGYSWNLFENLLMVACGLGLFLYGMKMMVDGLGNLAGGRMQAILKRATSNRFLGVTVGAFVTMIIQSSTAATVLIVGFVNAKLASLAQALSLIIGANIGTTLTAQIVSFRIDAYAPLFIFFGLLIHLCAKKRTLKNTGFLLLSIGMLFFGLSVMSGPLREFAQIPGFQAVLTAFENPILAVLAGFVFTVIVQSSTAATSIIVAMYLSGIYLSFRTAVFIVLGISIGTTVTALIASFGGCRESKRAAFAHLFFNLIGCVVFALLIFLIPGILYWFIDTWYDGARRIAMFYTIFKIGTAILLLPLIKQFSALLYKLIPKLPEEDLTPELAQSPEAVFTQAHAELCQMGKMTLNNLRLAIDAFYTKSTEKATIVIEIEETIDDLNRKITSWLARIQNAETMIDAGKLTALLYIASDIERIADHAENIAEYALVVEEHNTEIHVDAMEQLHSLGNMVVQNADMALRMFETNDEMNLSQVDDLEQQVDDLSKKCIESHIQRRLKGEGGDPRGTVLLISVVSDLERCSDHAKNIAHSICP